MCNVFEICILHLSLIRPMVPTKVTPAYALFEDLKDTAYTFFVTSENENGTAHQTPARLDVPSSDKSKLSFHECAF